MYGYNLPFGLNNAMSVNQTGQNAMIAPGSYGGDPYTVNGTYGAPSQMMPGAMTPAIQQQYNFARSSEGMAPLPGAGPLSIQDFRASMAPYAPQPANPYQGMTPFGNHYTRYLMGGGQRQNRLARPYGGQRDMVRQGLQTGQYRSPSIGFQDQRFNYSQPYDSVG